MTATAAYSTETFVVSGVPVRVKIPSAWVSHNDVGLGLRGPQIKAKLCEVCREKFGPGFLHDGADGYKWLHVKPTDLPEVVQLLA